MSNNTTPDFGFTEVDENNVYNFTANPQAGDQVCPECCIGGAVMSTDYLFNNTVQMDCVLGEQVYDCSSSGPLRLLTFNCSDTAWVNSILLRGDSASVSSLPSSAAASATSSASSGSSASGSSSMSSSGSSSGSASPAASASTSDSAVNAVPLLAIVLLSLMVLVKQLHWN